jgi:predicted Zn-dependent peptidase
MTAPEPGHWTIPRAPNSTRAALDMILDLLAEARAEEALTKAREAIARERRERKEDR